MQFDVRTIIRLGAVPPLLMAVVLAAANPGWHDLWRIPGGLGLIALLFLPERLPPLARLVPGLLGAFSLGYGLAGDYAGRNLYTLLFYLLIVVDSALLPRKQAAEGTLVTTVVYLLARGASYRSIGQEYWITTILTDILGFAVLSLLVYWMAEGQRQIRALNAQLADRSRQTETELHRTLEASRDIVMVTDLAGIIISISPACTEILGYPPDELTGSPYRSLLHVDSAASGQKSERDLLESGRLTRFENRFVRRDGQVVWLAWHASLDREYGVVRSVGRDITERKLADQFLLESEQRYRALFDCNPDAVLLGSLDCGMLGANPAFAAVTGYDPKALVGMEREARLDLLFSGQAQEKARWVAHFAGAGRGEQSSAAITITHRQGHLVHLEVTFIPLAVRGEILGVYAVARDVTERKAAEVERARLAAVLEATTDFVCQFTPDGKGLYLNRSARSLAGLEHEQAWRLEDLYVPASLEQLHREAIPTALRAGTWSGETVRRSCSGVEVPVSQVILAHRAPDGTVEYLSSIARDILERKRFEAELAYQATHDSLTGLLNRRGFEEALTVLVRDHSGAVLYLDLDEFKYVNDSLGHRGGDQLLVNLGLCLRGHLRQGDVLSRLSGDEFAVLLPHAEPEAAQALAESILESLRRQPLEASGQQITITASIGVALFPHHGNTLEELLAHADQAMYQAKEKGRNIVAVYTPDSDWETRVEYRMTWERLIRTALDRNGMVLFAQPILDLSDGHVSHYELLLRMTDEHGGLVPPATFLQVAERFGLIHQIDRWVVRQAIHLLSRLEREGRDLFLEVNLSGKALTDPELLLLIRRELTATGIAPHRLVFEITETAAIGDFDVALEFINVLKCLGCRFALDDFGAGFSSFDRLKRLPVDYLKLDGSFIRNLPTDEEDRHLVKAMVEVARSLGKQTIAEFVENAETVEILQRSGVDFAQGYHVGRPRPVSEIWPLPRREEATAE